MANLDKNKAATWITAHANASSHGKCATYVRQALEAGELSTAGHPVDAKNYGPFLQMQGFSKVSMQGYFPQKGDVVVIQNHPGAVLRATSRSTPGRSGCPTFANRT